MQKILRIDETDNLIVALKDLHAGEVYQWGDESITLVTDVKAKHKFARKQCRKAVLSPCTAPLSGKQQNRLPAGK